LESLSREAPLGGFFCCRIRPLERVCGDLAKIVVVAKALLALKTRVEWREAKSLAAFE
jgi:hypothetical protein